jgi:NADH-quinone oxidoreductase subunit F
METDRWDSLCPQFEYEQMPPKETNPSQRHFGHELPATARARNQEEVVTGLTSEEALVEACRCLRCDVRTVEES